MAINLISSPRSGLQSTRAAGPDRAHLPRALSSVHRGDLVPLTIHNLFRHDLTSCVTFSAQPWQNYSNQYH